MTVANDLLRAPWRRERFRRISWLGIFDLEDWSIRASWGQISFNSIGLGLELDAHYERAHLMLRLPFFWAFIYLPFLRGFATGDMNNQPSYGFHWYPDMGCHLHWGRHVKILEMPWSGYQICREFLAEDGVWTDNKFEKVSWAEVDGAKEPLKEEHPYAYMLTSGETQRVTATVHRERTKVGSHWFGRGRISRVLRSLQKPLVRWREYIEIDFSGEVGERAGSWKGGCVGCSYEMRPGETPFQALRRMQGERKFR